MQGTYLHIPRHVWARLEPDTDHGHKMHTPYCDGGEADGGDDEEAKIADAAVARSPSEQQEGGVGSEDRDDDGQDEDAGLRVEGDVVGGVPVDEGRLVIPEVGWSGRHGELIGKSEALARPGI